MIALLLAAALQLPDTTCVRVTAVIGTRTRADTVAHVRCLPPRVDTVRLVRVDTLRLVRVDTLWRDRPAPDSTPRDSLPTDSLPTDSLPRDSVPPDSLPADTLPTPQPSGVAELPRAVPTWPAHLATAPCTQTIAATWLQAAVGRARPGDVLCLAPGDRFRGTLTLPERGDSGWVVVRTAPASGQPLPGTRVRPSQGTTLATIEATGTASAIVTAPRASGWYLTTLEVRTDSTLGTLTYALVDLQTPTRVTDFARDLVLDRLWIHGWAHRPLRRCLALNSASTAIVHSWLDECHEKGADSQAIWGASGPGPFLIHDNYLAGAGENVMFGGSDPRFRGVHPSDITFSRNHVHTPLAWKGRWTKKNVFELKNAQRVRVDSNVFDGSWADGQTGYALVLKSTNQGCGCPDCGSRDVTVRHNLIVRSGAALTVNGRDTNKCANGGSSRVDSTTRRLAIQENFSDSLGALTLDTRGVSIYTNPSDVLLRRNSWLAPPGQVNAYTGASPVTATRLTIDGDVLTRGRYFLSGCWTAACAPGLTLRAALIGSGSLPAHAAAFTQLPTLDAALAAGFGVSRATIDAATRGVVITP